MKLVEQFMIQKLGGEGTGHDHFHSFRVRAGDLQVVECAALLHDVPDVKICPNVEETLMEIRTCLATVSFSQEQIAHMTKDMIQTDSGKHFAQKGKSYKVDFLGEFLLELKI